MAKNRKDKMDDRVFEYLLKDYERSSLSSDEKKELVSKLTAAADSDKGSAGGSFTVRPWALLAAAAALVLVFGLSLFLYRAPLENTYTVTADGRAEVHAEAGSITAPPGNEVELRSGSELVVLSPGTELTVKGAPLRRLTGKKENTYGLKSGDVYIEHSGESFRLETGYGVFSPVGTIISCSAAPDVIVLTCLEGRMKIKPNRGEGFFLEEGWVLTAKKAEDLWLSDVSKIPAAIEYYIPERLSGGVQPDSREVTPSESAKIQDAPAWIKSWNIGSSGLLSASLTGDRLYIFNGSSLESFDFTSGEKISETAVRNEYKFSSLYENILFGYSDSSLEALNADTGELLWSLDDAPVVYAGFTAIGGKLYLPSVDGRLYIFGTDDGGGPAVFRSAAGLYGLTAASGGMAVFSSIDKKISCVSAEGGNLLWQAGTDERLMGDKPVFSEDGSAVLFYDESGRLILLDTQSSESVAEGRFSPPMTIPPTAVREYFIYQDGGGIRIADVESLELVGTAGGEKLIAAGRAGESAAFITDEGFSVIKGGRIITMSRRMTGGAFIGGSAVILTSGGELEKWGYK